MEAADYSPFATSLFAQRQTALATRWASEFCQWRAAKVIGEWKSSLFATSLLAIRIFFPLQRGEAERRQTQNQPPRLRARRALSGARTPVGVPPRLLHRRTNATAQSQAALPGT